MHNTLKIYLCKGINFPFLGTAPDRSLCSFFWKFPVVYRLICVVKGSCYLVPFTSAPFFKWKKKNLISAFEKGLKINSSCHDTNPWAFLNLSSEIIMSYYRTYRCAEELHHHWNLLHYFLSQAGGGICLCCRWWWWCSGLSSYLSSASLRSRTFWGRHTENAHGLDENKLPAASQTRNFWSKRS